MQEKEIQTIIKAVMDELKRKDHIQTREPVLPVEDSSDGSFPEIDLSDPTLSEARQRPGIENPADAQGLLDLMAATPTRIGVGRSGPRPRTSAILLFQADHGITQDALMREVDATLLDQMGLFTVESCARDRQEYLKRPDLGRRLTEDSKKILAQRCMKNPDVQIFVGDGLSGAAIEHNLRQILPILKQGIEGLGLSMGTPFFVKNARVGLLNDVNAIVDAKVCAVLIGERPGLARAQSMSLYLGYRPAKDSNDAHRDAICNIYEDGLNPLEAGAFAVQLIQKMMARKTSGVELKKEPAA